MQDVLPIRKRLVKGGVLVWMPRSAGPRRALVYFFFTYLVIDHHFQGHSYY